MSNTLPQNRDESVLARVLDALTTFGEAELESSVSPWDDAFLNHFIAKLTVMRFSLAGAAPSPGQPSATSALVAITCASEKHAVDDPLAVAILSSVDFVVQVCFGAPERFEAAYEASAPKLLPLAVEISLSRWLRADIADMDKESLEYVIDLAFRYVVIQRLVNWAALPNRIDRAVARVDRVANDVLTALVANRPITDDGSSAVIDYSSIPYPNWRS